MFSIELKKLWASVGAATFIYLAFMAFQYFDGGERLAEYFDPHPEGTATVRGDLLRDRGELDEAIAQFDKAIGLSPKWYVPYTERAVAYRMKGDYARAIADLDRSIALKADNADAYYERGAIHRIKGDTERALADLGQAIRVNPDMTEVFFLRATIAREQRNFAGAMDDLDQAIRRRGDKADWYVARATIALFELDRPAQAADDFASAARAALKYRGFRMMFYKDTKSTAPGEATGEMMDYRHAFVPDGYYLFLWTHVARLRAGQDDRTEMAELVHELAQPIWRDLYFKRMSETLNERAPDLQKASRTVEEEAQARSLVPWPGAIFGLFQGKTTPEAVRAAADTTGDAERRQRTCDADFYIGIYRLQNGDRAAARAFLQSAADGCAPDKMEARLAATELARLGP